MRLALTRDTPRQNSNGNLPACGSANDSWQATEGRGVRLRVFARRSLPRGTNQCDERNQRGELWRTHTVSSPPNEPGGAPQARHRARLKASRSGSPLTPPGAKAIQGKRRRASTCPRYLDGSTGTGRAEGGKPSIAAVRRSSRRNFAGIWLDGLKTYSDQRSTGGVPDMTNCDRLQNVYPCPVPGSARVKGHRSSVGKEGDAVGPALTAGVGSGTSRPQLRMSCCLYSAGRSWSRAPALGMVA